MQGPFLLATSHRFDKLSHWITYMFFGNPFQCFVCYYYKAKVPAMKENQQIRLLSYLTINKIREKQLVLPLRSHRLDWSFYFTVLSRVWQRSMGWSGTHISLPSAGVAGPCYHTWLLQDTMSFKIYSQTANRGYGEDIDWSLDVSPFQVCHPFRPITGSTIKATPNWKKEASPTPLATLTSCWKKQGEINVLSAISYLVCGRC